MKMNIDYIVTLINLKGIIANDIRAFVRKNGEHTFRGNYAYSLKKDLTINGSYNHLKTIKVLDTDEIKFIYNAPYGENHTYFWNLSADEALRLLEGLLGDNEEK